MKVANINAGELVVGDKVYTAHEETGEYGLYNVEYVKIKQEQRLKVTFEDGFEFIGPKHINPSRR